MRAASLLWLMGGVTLVVFAEPLARVLIARWRSPRAVVHARRTLLAVGLAEVLVGLVFLAGLGPLGMAANLLVLVFLLARLGRPKP